MRIERPLFAKITANRVNFGNVLDVNLAGSHRPGISQAPQPQLANRYIRELLSLIFHPFIVFLIL